MVDILFVVSKTKGKVEARIQLIDFAKNNPEAFNALKSAVADLNVGILGNYLFYFPLTLLIASMYDSEQRRQVALDANIFC